MTLIGSAIAINYTKPDKDECVHFLTHIPLNLPRGTDVSEIISPTAHKICTSTYNIQLLERHFGYKDEKLVALDPRNTYSGKVADEYFSVKAIKSFYNTGSMMLLFRGVFGTILYTGFLGTSPSMIKLNIMNSIRNKMVRVDRMYLDSTYLELEARFSTTSQVVSLICQFFKTNVNRMYYLHVAPYGMEDVLAFIAENIGECLVVDTEMLATLKELGYDKHFTTNESRGRIQVISKMIFNKRDRGRTKRHLVCLRNIDTFCQQFQAYCKQKVSDDIISHQFTIYGHCNYYELEEWIKAIDPVQTVPLYLGSGRSGGFTVEPPDKLSELSPTKIEMFRLEDKKVEPKIEKVSTDDEKETPPVVKEVPKPKKKVVKRKRRRRKSYLTTTGSESKISTKNWDHNYLKYEPVDIIFTTNEPENEPNPQGSDNLNSTKTNNKKRRSSTFNASSSLPKYSDKEKGNNRLDIPTEHDQFDEDEIKIKLEDSDEELELLLSKTKNGLTSYNNRNLAASPAIKVEDAASGDEHSTENYSFQKHHSILSPTELNNGSHIIKIKKEETDDLDRVNEAEAQPTDHDNRELDNADSNDIVICDGEVEDIIVPIMPSFSSSQVPINVPQAPTLSIPEEPNLVDPLSSVTIKPTIVTPPNPVNKKSGLSLENDSSSNITLSLDNLDADVGNSLLSKELESPTGFTSLQNVPESEVHSSAVNTDEISDQYQASETVSSATKRHFPFTSPTSTSKRASPVIPSEASLIPPVAKKPALPFDVRRNLIVNAQNMVSSNAKLSQENDENSSKRPKLNAFLEKHFSDTRVRYENLNLQKRNSINGQSENIRNLLHKKQTTHKSTVVYKYANTKPQPEIGIPEPEIGLDTFRLNYDGLKKYSSAKDRAKKNKEDDSKQTNKYSLQSTLITPTTIPPGENNQFRLIELSKSGSHPDRKYKFSKVHPTDQSGIIHLDSNKFSSLKSIIVSSSFLPVKSENIEDNISATNRKREAFNACVSRVSTDHDYDVFRNKVLSKNSEEVLSDASENSDISSRFIISDIICGDSDASNSSVSTTSSGEIFSDIDDSLLPVIEEKDISGSSAIEEANKDVKNQTTKDTNRPQTARKRTCPLPKSLTLAKQSQTNKERSNTGTRNESQSSKELNDSELNKELSDSEINKETLNDSELYKEHKDRELNEELKDSELNKENLNDSELNKELIDSELNKNLTDTEINKELKEKLYDSELNKELIDSELNKNLTDAEINKELKDNELNKEKLNDSELNKELIDSELNKNLTDTEINKELKDNELNKEKRNDSELNKELIDSKLNKKLTDSEIDKKLKGTELNKEKLNDSELDKELKDTELYIELKDTELYKEQLSDSKLDKEQLDDSKLDNELTDTELNKELKDTELNDSEINKELSHSELNKEFNHSELNKVLNNSELDKGLNDSKLDKGLSDSGLDKELNDSELDIELNDSELIKGLNDSELGKELNDSELNQGFNDSKLDKGLSDSELDKELNDSKLDKGLKDSELDKDLNDSELDSGLNDSKHDKGLNDSNLDKKLIDSERYKELNDPKLDIELKDTELNKEQLNDSKLDKKLNDSGLDKEFNNSELNKEFNDSKLNSELDPGTLEIGCHLDNTSSELKVSDNGKPNNNENYHSSEIIPHLDTSPLKKDSANSMSIDTSLNVVDDDTPSSNNESRTSSASSCDVDELDAPLMKDCLMKNVPLEQGVSV